MSTPLTEKEVSVIILNLISDFWKSSFSSDDIELMSRFFYGYYSALITMEHRIERTTSVEGLDSLEEYFFAPFMNYPFTFDPTAEGHVYGQYQIDGSIISINTLSDKILNPTTTFTENTDYTIKDDTTSAYKIITFNTDFDEETILWGNIVLTDDSFPYERFGKLINLTKSDSETIDQYCTKLRVLTNAYYNSPTFFHIKSGIASLLGIPLSLSDDEKVWKINGPELYVGNTVYTIPDILWNYGLDWSVSIGDTPELFQSLTGGIIVEDYLTHDNWWQDYGISIDNEGDKYKMVIRYNECFNPSEWDYHDTEIDYFLTRIISSDLSYIKVKHVE